MRDKNEIMEQHLSKVGKNEFEDALHLEVEIDIRDILAKISQHLLDIARRMK